MTGQGAELNDRVKQFLSINVTGRVFMLCTGEGMKSAIQIREYQEAIRESLEDKARQGASPAELEMLLNAELEQLRLQIHSLQAEAPRKPVTEPDAQAKSNEPAKQAPEDADSASSAAANKQADNKTPAAPDNSESSDNGDGKDNKPTHKPETAAYQEKLKISRKPVSELLIKDCVNHQLLSPKRAKYWVHNLSGRLIEDVEKDIVAELAKNLQESVKKYIRKNKGHNPWSTPRLQEDLRMDISSVKTVRGMVLLSSQIGHEINTYGGGKPGILKRLTKGWPLKS